MRDILHAVVLALVLAVAALCTLVQLGDVQHAVDRLSQDEGVIQPVSSDRGGAPPAMGGRSR
jgi:hypothetical protein